MLTEFQCLTFTGWGYVTSRVMDNTSPIVLAFFVVIVVVGGLFVVSCQTCQRHQSYTTIGASCAILIVCWGWINSSIDSKFCPAGAIVLGGAQNQVCQCTVGVPRPQTSSTSGLHARIGTAHGHTHSPTGGQPTRLDQYSSCPQRMTA
jgi:hypothetical protein